MHWSSSGEGGLLNVNAPHSVEPQTRRDEIDRLIASGETSRAALLLGQVWRQNPGLAQAGFVVSRFEKIDPSLSRARCRIAVLRSFTVEPLVPLLRASAAVNGIAVTVHVGDFNTYAQELLDPSSSLYRFDPDIVILAAQARDVAPDLWSDFAQLSPQQVEQAVQRVSESCRCWVQAFHSRSKAHLVIHNLEMPCVPFQGVLDGQSPSGQVAALQRINGELKRLASEHTGVYVLDYDGLIARHGHEQWHDERKWLTMRMPIAADKLIHLANEWLRFIHPLTGRACKVLVTDLDNTLWGGVIGEDGFEGIKVGTEYPGAAYQALQRAMLDLHHRGILLAVCSKNNADEAMAALQRHPGMLLRPQHFAAMRINWNDKVQNLREIAAELNIGTDALAFLDDNPVERELVRAEMPEVTVIQLPQDAVGFAAALRDSPVFERLALSAEDRERGRYYAEQRQRTEVQQRAVSIEDFYRSLEQEVEIAHVTPQTLSRVAQLTEKTNQFNLTTRRYSEQQIASFATDPACEVLTVRVRDRFGDNGLVGVAIVRFDGEVCEIDTLLLSCRVIGRTVETAVLAWLAERSRARGAKQLRGWFVATNKNAPAKDVYSKHSFQLLEEEAGTSLWAMDLAQAAIRCPEWITLRTIGEPSQ